jgi:hypothetical protein
MAGGGTYMGMMNEFQENHGLDWDGLGNPPEQQQDTQMYNTPTRTKETKKQEFL